MLISFLFTSFSIAETLEQKKVDLKKSIRGRFITKTEFKRAQDFLENSDEKKQEEKSKKTLNLTKKKKSKKSNSKIS